MIFITNKEGCYFAVSIQNINTENLDRCTVHENISDMYNFVCQRFELDINEVAHNEVLFHQKGNVIWEVSSGGGGIPLDLNENQTIEEYISDFSL